MNSNGKRVLDEEANGEWIQPRRQMVMDDEVGGEIKHYISDVRSGLDHKHFLSYFKTIVAFSIHEESIDGTVSKHYHLLGEAKMSKRKIRDMSLDRLRAMQITGGLEAKDQFVTCRVKNVLSEKHFINCRDYIKKNGNNIVYDPTIQYRHGSHPVFKIIDQSAAPDRFTKTDMDEFKQRFPLINSWKKDATQKRWSKQTIGIMEEMEKQRQFEESIKKITPEEFHLLLPNTPIIKHAYDLRSMMRSHDQNSGVCLILCGAALTCKSTLSRIIAESFGCYNIWPGSQWITKDNLKFDTAARQGINTIVVEEMQWIDVQHKVTLEKTLTTIKEQLTGAGLDVRLAKTKTSLTDDIKFKLENLIISMNEDEYVNYRTLSSKINSKPEFMRRFILINMDDPKYGDLVQLRQSKNNNWRNNEQR